MDKAIAVLDDFLQPIRQALTRDQARKLAEFRAGTETQLLMDDLARKASEGTLSDKERAEYEAFVVVGDFIAILQAEARGVLADH